MNRILFRLGPWEVTSYGVMLTVAFALGIYVSAARARRRGIEPGPIVDLGFWILVAALLGSRAMYVLFHLEEFQGRWLETIYPFGLSSPSGIGGLTFLGGGIAAFITTLVFLRVKHALVLRMADIIVPALPLGMALGRLGCFMNGCCYGLPTDVGWGMIFPLSTGAGYQFPGQPIHPTQLYQSAYSLSIFILLLWLESRFHRSERTMPEGTLFFAFLVLNGLARFTVDFFRYYEESMVVLSLGEVHVSMNQGISVFFAATGLFFLWKKRIVD